MCIIRAGAKIAKVPFHSELRIDKGSPGHRQCAALWPINSQLRYNCYGKLNTFWKFIVSYIR